MKKGIARNVGTVGVAALALALSLASCSGGSSDVASSDGGPGDDSTASGGACKVDADCAARVPSTAPADCAVGKCDPLQGQCAFTAKDQDGDGHPAANCKATGGGVVQPGDDCDDNNPQLFPGQPQSCTASPDGGTAVDACKTGQIKCLPDGTKSSCTGTVICNEQACVAGACIGTCTPGQTQCSSNGVQTCTSTGAWSDPVSCGSSTCVSGACAGTCSAGSLQCSGNGVQTCSGSGMWNAPVPCNSMTCNAGTCQGVCAPGQKQCSSNGVQTCSSTGTWGAPASCSHLTCLSGICQGVCGPGDAQCTGQTPQTCNSTGQWVSGNACPFLCSGTGTCTGTCSAGSTRNCGQCGTETCTGNDQWGGSCANQGVCTAGTSQNCNWSYPFGCPLTQQTCAGNCQFPGCSANPQNFNPNAGGVCVGNGVDCVNLQRTFVSGPNCFGSTNNYGPYTVCPSGSVLVSSACTMVDQGGGVTGGSCTVSNASSTQVSVSVHANNNCSVNAQAKLNIQCRPVSCGTSHS